MNYAVFKWLSLFQVLVLLSGCGERKPECRTDPLRVNVIFQDDRVCSESERQKLLNTFRPSFRSTMPHVATLEHAMRLWAGKGRNDAGEELSSTTMASILCNSEMMYESYPGAIKPVLTHDAEFGWRFGFREGPMSSSHRGHTLACLMEAQVGLEFPVSDNDSHGVLRDVLVDSMVNFSLDDEDIEWSTLAFVLGSSAKSWANRKGEIITHDAIARELMSRGLSGGECYGTHVLYTLSVILQANGNSQIVAPTTESDIVVFLQRSTKKAMVSQNLDGSWDKNWRDSLAGTKTFADGSMIEAVHVTGHLLEYWAIAPESAHPSTEAVIRASRWLLPSAAGVVNAESRENFSITTHAVRALVMLSTGRTEI